jgi:hypothetical protein
MKLPFAGSPRGLKESTTIQEPRRHSRVRGYAVSRGNVVPMTSVWSNSGVLG